MAPKRPTIPPVNPPAPERSEQFKRGRTLKEMGDLDGALTCFEWELKEKPDDAAVLNELIKLYHALEKHDKAKNTMNRLMSLYTSAEDRDRAVVLFGEINTLYPQHCFEEKDQRKLIDWLEEIKDYDNLFVALRNLAYFHPELPDARGLLMRAAAVATAHLNNSYLAEKIMEYANKHHPE